jgi:hypothetical protein
MIELIEEEGKLRLVPNKRELEDCRDLYDALEMSGYIGNGTILTTADQLDQLSEADIIIYNDSIYYYPYYMLNSVIDLLKSGEEVEFGFMSEVTEEDLNLIYGED